MAAYKKAIAATEQAAAAELQAAIAELQAAAAEEQAAAAEARLIKQRYSTPTTTEPSNQSIHSDKVMVNAERAIKPIKSISTTSKPIEPIQVSERTQTPEQINIIAVTPELIQEEPCCGRQIRAPTKQKIDAAEAPQQQQQ